MILYFGELKKQKNTVLFLREFESFSKRETYFKKLRTRQKRKEKEHRIDVRKNSLMDSSL